MPQPKYIPLTAKVVICSECEAFYPTSGEFEGWGVCHRHAPAPAFAHATEQKNMIVLWPLVRKDQWCFEGVPRG